MIVDYSFKVKWGDTDAAGIVFIQTFINGWMKQHMSFFSCHRMSTSTLYGEQQVSVP